MHKAVGLVGVSTGPWGGVRMIESFLPVARELGLVVSKKDLLFPMVGDLFAEDGIIQNEKMYNERTQIFLNEIVWLSRALKRGREEN